jgi:hypothetical protein
LRARTASGRLGAWLWAHYQSPPDWVPLGGVWPLGDSPPVLVTALTAESSRWTTVPRAEGATAHVCTDVDFRLVVGDMLAKLRGHERLRTTRSTDRPGTAREDARMPQQHEQERAVLDAEDRRYQAMIDADLQTMDRLCADELSYAHSSGVRDTKQQYFEKVRSGYYDYHSIDHPVERVEVLGDTAIVVGRMTADLTVQGTRKTIDNLALAVWTKDGGEWRLLAYAPTPLPG